MTKKELFNVAVAGVSSLALAGQFICLPVFADNPVDISIVEVVDDEEGGFKPWEDITGAMPGETYSAIPRVKNDGSVPVSVRTCLSESATDSAGEVVALPSNTFEIDINEHWILDSDGATDPSDPASGNCYDYDSELEVGAVTEPIFSEVTLSGELGNEYQNSTFNLHLSATAKGEETPTPEPEPEPEPEPSKPDTGVNTASYFEIVKPVFFSAGAIIVFAVVAFILRRINKKN